MASPGGAAPSGRMALYGYRPDEEESIELELQRFGFSQVARKLRAHGALMSLTLSNKMISQCFKIRGKNQPLRTQLEVFNVKHAYPVPDYSDPMTLFMGICCRMAGEIIPPVVDEQILLFHFTREWMSHFVPRLESAILGADWCHNARRWIDSMDKNSATKSRWLKVWENIGLDDHHANMQGSMNAGERIKELVCGAFGKDEAYACKDSRKPAQDSVASGGITPARNIMGITDYERIAFGDLIKKVCQEMLGTLVGGHTVCGLTPREMCTVLWKKFCHVLCALGLDFSRFENWFTRVRMWVLAVNVEHAIVRGNPVIFRTFCYFTMLEATGKFRSSTFSGQTMNGHNPSGTHWTYFRNTVANWIMSKLVEFMCTGKWPRIQPTLELHNVGDLDLAEPAEVYGGDDAKTVDRGQKQEYYDKIGVPIKFEGDGSPEDVAFFKMRSVVKTDGSIGIAADIEEMVTKLVWVAGKLAKSKESKILAMYKAKALSYLCLAPDNPVISKICSLFLFNNRRIDVRTAKRHMDPWHWERVQMAIEAERKLDKKYENGHHVWYEGNYDNNITYECAKMLNCSSSMLLEIDEQITYAGGRFHGLERLSEIFSTCTRNVYDLYVTDSNMIFTRPRPLHRKATKAALEASLAVGNARWRDYRIAETIHTGI